MDRATTGRKILAYLDDRAPLGLYNDCEFERERITAALDALVAEAQADARRAALEGVLAKLDTDADEYDDLARRAYTSAVGDEREIRAETLRTFADFVRAQLDKVSR